MITLAFSSVFVKTKVNRFEYHLFKILFYSIHNKDFMIEIENAAANVYKIQFEIFK